ncbi:hypothetical protein BJ508DRAFT_417943 [Ascobolus immersus RN42]|uniref:Uncharacterized protein n=1 Tax=Ascobolus immersus RN42 TaxID=1160509 RepID=A0A3N4HPL0_ASCIM|nr:hypothetical protein BJ508DRAFT_417943 [Ascobolus immersus RN42]
MASFVNLPPEIHLLIFKNIYTPENPHALRHILNIVRALIPTHQTLSTHLRRTSSIYAVEIAWDIKKEVGRAMLHEQLEDETTKEAKPPAVYIEKWERVLQREAQQVDGINHYRYCRPPRPLAGGDSLWFWRVFLDVWYDDGEFPIAGKCKLRLGRPVDPRGLIDGTVEEPERIEAALAKCAVDTVLSPLVGFMMARRLRVKYGELDAVSAETMSMEYDEFLPDRVGSTWFLRIKDEALGWVQAPEKQGLVRELLNA